MSKPRLAIWLHGMRIADVESRGFGDLRLRHTNEALERWPINAPVISCSLRIGRSWQPAAAYLRGLLPEGRHLAAAAHAANVATSDTYGLLVRYGRDVAGALVITRHDERPDESRWGMEPYTSETLAGAVDALDAGNDVVYPDSELSIAGLQNKLLLVVTGDGWARPISGRPSTHILKLDDPLRPGLIDAEHHALLAAANVGVDASESAVREIADRRCLFVRRFDRTVTEGVVQRVHQEDACQALGVHHEAGGGRGKYESAGGPSFKDVAELLRTDSRDADQELRKLARLMTFTVVVGNADGHGKNVALLHDDDGYVRLAPAYDTVPTMLWPKLRTTPGMYVGGVADLLRVDRDALVRETRSWKLNSVVAVQTIDQTLDQLRAARIDHDDLCGLVAANLDRIRAK
jgi:serine/threonine-protein kinase HipA